MKLKPYVFLIDGNGGLVRASRPCEARDQADVASRPRVSIFSVLNTAIPSSLVAEALTNSAAVSAELASEFAAGESMSASKLFKEDRRRVGRTTV